MENQRYNIIKKYIPVSKDTIVLGIGEGYRQTIESNKVLKFFQCLELKF